MDSNTALVLGALITAVPTTITALGIYRQNTKTDAVSEQLAKASIDNLARTQVGNDGIAAIKHEVTPNNGLTNGETIDAIRTTQILAVSPELRTPEQTEHMTSMADNNPVAAVETLQATILKEAKEE